MDISNAIALAVNVANVVEFLSQSVRSIESFRLATRDQSERLENMQVDLKRYKDAISALGQGDIQQIYIETVELLPTVTRYLGSNTEREDFWGVVRRGVDMAPIMRKRREKELNRALTRLQSEVASIL